VSGLPKGWLETTLGQVTSKPQYGYTTKSTASGDVYYLRTTDLTSGKVNWDTVPYCVDNPNEISKYQLEDRDIVISRAGSVGFHSLIKSPPLNAVFASYLIRFKPSILIDERYLSHFFNSKAYWSQITEKSAGVAVQNVNATKLSDLNLPLAPTNEQTRIADKLDSMLAKVDAAQVRLDKIPNILKRFRQSVLAAATSGELTKEWRGNNEYKYKRENIEGKFELDWEIVKESTLPQHWQWVPLGNFAKCARGKFSIRPRNDPSCFDGAYPFIQIGDLPREGGNIISHKQTLNDKGYSVSREFEIGTVVIAIVGATIANTGIVTYPVCFPDSLVGINSPSNIENQYLDYHLRAVKEEIRQASYAGGGQPNIKLTMINPLPLPLPPYEEILEIVRRVESLFTMAATVEKQYKDAKARTNRLTQSILAKAFRGKLVSQDESAEPASVLLARIEAELTAINTKAKAKPKTKKKIKAV
jgi:type I restriction enzyme S subunit